MIGIKIVYGEPSNHDITDFVYDPQGRCVKSIETTSGSITERLQFVWVGSSRNEVRNGSGAVLRQLFASGETISGANRYFEKDHLGSIRAMRNEVAGVEAEYGFDPFGRVRKLQGNTDADFQYATYYVHGRSGLNLTRTRPYNANLGRFIGRDPIEEDGGVNLYAYVDNDPINLIDPSGLMPAPRAFPPIPPIAPPLPPRGDRCKGKPPRKVPEHQPGSGGGSGGGGAAGGGAAGGGSAGRPSFGPQLPPGVVPVGSTAPNWYSPLNAGGMEQLPKDPSMRPLPNDPSDFGFPRAQPGDLQVPIPYPPPDPIRYYQPPPMEIPAPVDTGPPKLAPTWFDK